MRYFYLQAPPQNNYPQYGSGPSPNNQQPYPPPYNQHGGQQAGAANYGYPPQGASQQQYQNPGEASSYYGTGAPPSAQAGYGPGPAGPEGDRGLGSTLAGGAVGGFAGHKMGGGFLGTAGGAVLGAVGMNMATHEMSVN
ncbi:hypothetical protein N7456_012512 [Penicillium angulare]|uniref:Glycine zipper 2TM domain-containing protein n=1 Tax=Penicillium angulare TaxID=116970 RepID=A0A9W9EW01_9EURO|nr:hypothetical protein N7456_012512 [Penicillium angulare]